MSKIVTGLTVVLVSLLLVTSVGAGGHGIWKKDQFMDTLNPSAALLTDSELNHLLYMREEEKLARDVYLTFSEQYTSQIFTNISKSEQRHMDALKNLIVKYNLEDPVVNDDVGVFTNPVFFDLYEQLVGQGMENYCEALQAGIDIEELDIVDISDALEDVSSQDLRRVLNNLRLGSENHLNAFTLQHAINDCN